MKKKTSKIEIYGTLGRSGGMDVFLGFASASDLFNSSFADILNEETGEGYQRPFNHKHSADFKQYISRPYSSTPPLVFNLRDDLSYGWDLTAVGKGTAKLILSSSVKPLSQVDCQHRLGSLEGSDVMLSFMTFVGLSLRQEMAMFNVINGKTKGLSSSLTDFHESRLIDDLICHAPQLYIARKLNEDTSSPWYQTIRYGGENTSGLMRRTSLRMMQKAVKELLSKNSRYGLNDPNYNYELIANFWSAIRVLFPAEWDDHRHHLLTKGVGLYSLTQLLADCVSETNGKAVYSEDFFIDRYKQLKEIVDWTSKGEFASANGRKGANEVYLAIREKLAQ